MTIQLKNWKPASEETIVAIEGVLECPLSESVRKFLTIHDGAKPESNTCKVTEECSFSVRRFIPTAEILLHRKYIDGLPQKAYPVAEDDCGNFVIVDEGRNGAVYFGIMKSAVIQSNWLLVLVNFLIFCHRLMLQRFNWSRDR
jgi:hypothetical protein